MSASGHTHGNKIWKQSWVRCKSLFGGESMSGGEVATNGGEELSAGMDVMRGRRRELKRWQEPLGAHKRVIRGEAATQRRLTPSTASQGATKLFLIRWWNSFSSSFPFKPKFHSACSLLLFCHCGVELCVMVIDITWLPLFPCRCHVAGSYYCTPTMLTSMHFSSSSPNWWHCISGRDPPHIRT